MSVSYTGVAPDAGSVLHICEFAHIMTNLAAERDWQRRGIRARYRLEPHGSGVKIVESSVEAQDGSCNDSSGTRSLRRSSIHANFRPLQLLLLALNDFSAEDIAA